MRVSFLHTGYTQYKKALICMGVALSILGFIGGVNAQQKVTSSSYTTVTSCQSAIEENNRKYPGYDRSSCFNQGGDYYYYICEKGMSCGTTATQKMDVEDEMAIKDSLSMISDENPYAKYFSSSILEKLKRITANLESKKESLSAMDFNKVLDTLNSRLDRIEAKYSSSTVIMNLVNYLKYETTRLRADTTVDDFFCELTGDCEDDKPTEVISCPHYALATPKAGCKYIYEKDENGCSKPRLVCESTGNEGTGETDTNSENTTNNNPTDTNGNNTQETDTPSGNNVSKETEENGSENGKSATLTSTHDTVVFGYNNKVTVTAKVNGYAACDFSYQIKGGASGTQSGVRNTFGVTEVINTDAVFKLSCADTLGTKREDYKLIKELKIREASGTQGKTLRYCTNDRKNDLEKRDLDRVCGEGYKYYRVLDYRGSASCSSSRRYQYQLFCKQTHTVQADDKKSSCSGELWKNTCYENKNYFSIVKNYYITILKRQPDKSGLDNYYNQLLNKKITSSGVRNALYNSPEYKRNNSEPSCGGIEWKGKCYTNKSYFNSLKSAYKSVLDREPDKSGFNHYYDQLVHKKMTITQIKNIFRNSSEYNRKNSSNNTTSSQTPSQPSCGGVEWKGKCYTNKSYFNSLKSAYTSILGRQPDKAGFNYYYNQLVSKKVTLTKVRNIFYDSPEYKNK